MRQLEEPDGTDNREMCDFEYKDAGVSKLL
jgi:hypothetical protein